PSPQKHPGAPHTSADSTWPPSRPFKHTLSSTILAEHRQRGGRLGLAAAIVSDSILLSIARTRKQNFSVITYGAKPYSVCAFCAFLWHLSLDVEQLRGACRQSGRDCEGVSWAGVVARDEWEFECRGPA